MQGERVMPENAGLYRKYNVSPQAGGPSPFAWFVLDVTGDPHAKAALKAYAESCKDDLPKLAQPLFELVAELEANNLSGPQIQALRTPCRHRP
jgi:hypothetical protein